MPIIAITGDYPIIRDMLAAGLRSMGFSVRIIADALTVNRSIDLWHKTLENTAAIIHVGFVTRPFDKTQGTLDKLILGAARSGVNRVIMLNHLPEADQLVGTSELLQKIIEAEQKHLKLAETEGLDCIVLRTAMMLNIKNTCWLEIKKLSCGGWPIFLGADFNKKIRLISQEQVVEAVLHSFRFHQLPAMGAFDLCPYNNQLTMAGLIEKIAAIHQRTTVCLGRPPLLLKTFLGCPTIVKHMLAGNPEEFWLGQSYEENFLWKPASDVGTELLKFYQPKHLLADQGNEIPNNQQPIAKEKAAA